MRIGYAQSHTDARSSHTNALVSWILALIVLLTICVSRNVVYTQETQLGPTSTRRVPKEVGFCDCA